MVAAVQTYYQILGIGEDASPEQIATARRSVLKAVHPDLATSEEDRQERERLSRMVNDMCDTLLDPVRRWDYDRTLVRTRNSQETPRAVVDETDMTAGDDRWAPGSPADASSPWAHVPGLEWLDQWLTWRIAALSLVMLCLSVLVYDTVGGRILDRLGLHFGRFGSVAVVLVWTVLLVALCLGVARWVRARRTGPG